MTTPCLTRQNAFLLEDYELNSPLDLVLKLVECRNDQKEKKNNPFFYIPSFAASAVKPVRVNWCTLATVL